MGAAIGCLLAALFFRDILFSHKKTFLGNWDASVQSYAWHKANVEALRAGSIKLWDHTVSSGTSFIGEMQTAPLYPLNWVCALVPPAWDLSTLELLIVVHFVMAFAFAFLLLRHNGLSRLAAGVAAMIFAFSGSVASRSVGQPNIFASLVYLPLVIWGVQRACEHPSAWYRNPWVPITGAVLGAMFLAGHAQPAVHAGFAAMLWVVFAYFTQPRELLRRLACVLSIAACSGIFALPQLIALVEYMANSYRWVGLPDPTSPPHRIPYEMFGFHYVFGTRELASLWNSAVSGGDGSTFFFTQVGLVLGLVGLTAASSPLGRFAIGMGALAILIGLGDQSVLGRISYHVPLLKDIREPARIGCLVHLSCCILVALGIDRVRQSLAAAKQMAVLLVVIAGGLVALEIDGYLSRILPATTEPLYPANYYHQEVAQDLRKLTRENPAGPFRFIALPNEALPPNLGNADGALSARGHRATMQIAYHDLLGEDWNPAGKSFAKLGLRYVVTAAPDIPGFTKITTAGSLSLWERPDALGIFQLDAGSGPRTAPVRSVSYTQNGLRVHLDRHEAGTLTLGQVPYPGWKAWVDGKPQSLNTWTNLMSLDIPANASEIALLYRPAWLWPSAFLAIAAWLVLTGTAIIKFRNGGKFRASPGPLSPGLPASAAASVTAHTSA